MNKQLQAEDIVMSQALYPVEMPKGRPFPYHPNYGLTDNTRLKAVNLVRHQGLSVYSAAKKSNLHQSSIYRWLSDLVE